MKVALVYPPSTDPTAPYLSVPTLAAWLRREGIDVVPVDANLEGWLHVLEPSSLRQAADRIESRLSELDRKAHLTHEDQLTFSALYSARAEARVAPDEIESALGILRDSRRFHDPEAYAFATSAVERAQAVVSAAYAPLRLDFTAYRTPFSLLDAAEIERDSAPERNPFFDYMTRLAERLLAERATLVGVSVAFPGQLQPAYSLAHLLRRLAPDLHLTVGGPALTQILQRLSGSRLERALAPFHSAVVGEGEIALTELVGALTRGEAPRGVIRGRMLEDLSLLPAPDFDGLPLARYLSPEPVLPYDPTRGCYFGVCTFCHYGLAEVGTARYRRRPQDAVLDHLEALSRRHGARIFYFSQDVFDPKLALEIARGIRQRGLDLRWATDMRPERSLTRERCQELRAGGQLAAALGVESAAPRVLQLIDKGVPVETVADAITQLSAAGIAVEAMCFSDFPTETAREALATLAFLKQHEAELALFILGRFDLTHGSRIAQQPRDFGIREVWHVEGDELETGLFFAERRPSKSWRERERLETELERLSTEFLLRRYPWAGALGTAHTLLWYAEHGPDVFRRLARAPFEKPRPSPTYVARSRFDPSAIRTLSEAREADIWETLVQVERRVSRTAYAELAARLPPAEPSPCEVRFAIDHEPESRHLPRPKRRRLGRRPSHKRT